MPVMAILPAIIGAGAAIGGTALASRSASNNQQKLLEAQKTDPTNIAQQDLIKHQTEVGKWGFQQAQNLLPSAKGAIDLPFQHFKAILSGDPQAFNKAMSGANQNVDRQTDAARKNISAFAPRGAIAGQTAQLATQNAQAKQSNYFQAYINALSGAQGSATQYGNLFNSVLSSGQGAAVPALNSLTSQLGFQTQQDIASQQLRAQSLSGLGTGIGQILTSLLLNRGSAGGSRGSSTKGASTFPGTEGKA
jgi:hypothetical protein